MELLRPRPARDRVVESPGAEHVLPGQHVVPHRPSRLPHAELGRGVGQERVLEAGHVLHQEPPGLLRLRAAADLRCRRFEGIGHVRRVPLDADTGHRAQHLALAERGEHGSTRARQIPFRGLAYRREQLVEPVEPGRVRRLHVDVVHQELHRGELALAGPAALDPAAGVEGQVGVAGSIHEHPARDRERTPLRPDDDRLDGAAAPNDLGDVRVKQRSQVRLGGDPPIGLSFERPRHIDENRGLLIWDRAEAGARGLELLRPGLCEPPANEVESLSRRPIEAANRAHPSGHGVSSEEPVAFDERGTRAHPRRRKRCGEPGRSPADDDHVHVENNGRCALSEANDLFIHRDHGPVFHGRRSTRAQSTAGAGSRANNINSDELTHARFTSS